MEIDRHEQNGQTHRSAVGHLHENKLPKNPRHNLIMASSSKRTFRITNAGSNMFVFSLPIQLEHMLHMSRMTESIPLNIHSLSQSKHRDPKTPTCPLLSPHLGILKTHLITRHLSLSKKERPTNPDSVPCSSPPPPASPQSQPIYRDSHNHFLIKGGLRAP